MKKCKTCNISKELELFDTCVGCTYNVRSECKACRSSKSKENYLANRGKILTQNKLWKQNNSKKVFQANKLWKLNNQAQEQKNNRRYLDQNKDKIKDQRKQWEKRRRREEPKYRLRKNLSCLIRSSYRNGGYSKSSKLHEIIGLPYKIFFNYLESTFIQNYGILPECWGWDDIHIDHIMPLSSAKNKHDIHMLNHFTNLQLLISVDNIMKSNRTKDVN